MNEFQAILIEVTLFGLRFVIPAAIIYTSARLVHHYMKKEAEADENTGHVPQ
jgi:hypothetical protein